MHTEPYNFLGEVKKRFPVYFDSKKVLEVGSLNINGSVREFFVNCDYTGIDLGPGVGVDKIVPIHELNEPETYDVVVTTEMLEHDKWWNVSLYQMLKNLKKKGILILTCAGPDRQEHGTTRTTPGDAPFTNDYYSNISIEMFYTALPIDLFINSEISYERGKADLLFWGIKR